MTRDEKPRPVAIFTSGSSGLYADDRGVTVDGHVRIRRFDWDDISHFADGIRGVEGGTAWVLDIVLRSGRAVPVPCTAGSPTPELLAAVRRLAEVYGIPARLTGIVMKDGRPVDVGFYQDPGGQAGLRYWDGKRWSPLLRHTGGRGWPKGSQSAASWAELPVAPEPWTYPAARAARAMAWIRVWAVLTAGLLVTGVAFGLAKRDWNYLGFCLVSVITAAACLIPMWFSWRRWKTVKAASEPTSTDDAASPDPYGLLVQPPASQPAQAWADQLDRWMENAASPGQHRMRVAAVVLLVVAGFAILIWLWNVQGPLCSTC